MHTQNSLQVLLVISDDALATEAAALLAWNERFSFRWRRATSLAEALVCVTHEDVEVVVADLVLTDSAGISNFIRLQEAAPTLPIVLLADEANSHLGTYLLRLGAKDCLLKNTLAQIGLAEVIAYAFERQWGTSDLEAENRFLSAVLHTVQSLVLVLDREGRIVQMNHASEIASGYTQEELRGKYIWEHLIMPADIPFVQGIFTRLHPRLFPNQFVNQWRTHENTLRLISWSNTALLDSAGEVEYVIGTGLDVTDTHAAEQELRRKDGLYRALAANIPQTTIFLFDKNHICLLAEGEGLRTFADQEKEYMGKRLRDVVSPWMYEVIAPELDKTWAEESVTFEWATDGRAYAGQTVPVRDEEGEIFAGMMLIRDVTERKQAETRLVRAERLAALGQLAASLAHEISNPLQSISTYLELVLNYPLQSDEAREFLQVVQHQVRHLGTVSQNVLGFARAQTNNRRLIDLAALLEIVLQLTAPELQNHNVTVRVRQEPVPPVYGVSDMLQRVFLNLILNAMEAMPAGGTLQITLARQSEEPDAGIRITFQNPGPPIPEDVLPRIFEPFFTTKPDGSGLGLWISHNFVQQHNGELSIRNLPDSAGVLATLDLPAAT